MTVSRTAIKRIPAPAQDILTILDVVLQIINVIQAVFNLFTQITGGK